MDEHYRKTAAYYGFNCRGCDENCCMTLFFHHTFAEFFYLMEGVDALPADIRESLYKKAEAADRQASKISQNQKPYRLMCPLNKDGLCILYERRPLICRMHGIPHELRTPGREKTFGPGCAAFYAQCGSTTYIPFDRTPFYMEMANLEKELRQKLGISQKLKKTIARMLIEKNEISGY